MDKILMRDYEFPQAARDENGQRMEQSVLNFKNDILDQWVNGSHEEFETYLRICEQKYERANRVFENRTGREICLFYLGMVFGLLQVFRWLFLAEVRDKKVIMETATQSSRTREILFCLYQHGGGTGMRHGELADRIKTTYSNLTNMMKKILKSGAVEVSRCGKNTIYTLTKAGKRYCEERQSQYARLSTKQIMQNLSELIDQYIPEQKFKEGLGLPFSVGEEYIQTVNGGTPQKVRMNEIICILGSKFVSIETVDEEMIGIPTRDTGLGYERVHEMERCLVKDYDYDNVVSF